MFTRNLQTALRMLLVMTGLTGVAYPLAITVIGQTCFPRQSRGSVVQSNGRDVGSELIGQPFRGAGYFWSRPSATGPVPYNAAASSGSNKGPTHPDLRTEITARARTFRESAPSSLVPVDLVTASGSGLDPHITPAAADIQIARVATARGLPAPQIRTLVRQHTSDRQWGLLGEPRVNVLTLNLALDQLAPDQRGRD